MTCDECERDTGIFWFDRDCCVARHMRHSTEFYKAAVLSADGAHGKALEIVRQYPALRDAMRARVIEIRNKRRG